MEDKKFIFNRRIKLILVTLIIIFSLIITRLFWLQIYKNDFYIERSQLNSERIETIKPQRGIIYDRHKNVLAENILTYDLVINIEEKSNKDIENIINKLSEILPINDEDKKKFYKLKTERKFLRFIPILNNIDKKLLTLFISTKYQFPDVNVKEEFLRSYPHAHINSHLIGFINRISADDLNEFKQDQYLLESYFGLSHKGKQGVEKFFEESLKGKAGLKRIRVNAQNSFVNEVEYIPPINGNDLNLSIDLNLQIRASELLKDYKGAIIMSHVKTNEILAYQSNPTFDPNHFVNGIGFDEWNNLNLDPKKPMLDRIISATYPPGSTIKPFVSIAGLEHNQISKDFKISDPGYYRLPHSKKIFKDWKKEGHGEVDLIKAIAESCDVYFYDLAYRLGINKLSQTLSKFSFGNQTGIELPSEKNGILPSPEWKKNRHQRKWNTYETINTSIGQGDFLVTPIQLTQALNTLLNNTKISPPSIVLKENFNNDGIESLTITDDEFINIVKLGMQQVTGASGTFRSIAHKNLNKLAGKTGTAQVFSLKNKDYDEANIADHLKDHSLFIGYAPFDDPTVSIAVVIENGGHGSSVAAPIAKKLIDYYFELEMNHE